MGGIFGGVLDFLLERLGLVSGGDPTSPVWEGDLDMRLTFPVPMDLRKRYSSDLDMRQTMIVVGD